jgi:hypothetical protein
MNVGKINKIVIRVGEKKSNEGANFSCSGDEDMMHKDLPLLCALVM